MKPFYKLAALLMALLMLTAVFSACSSAEKDILGTWEHSTTTLGITTSTTFTFNDDGTGTKTTLVDVVAVDFTYEIKDDTLIVTTNLSLKKLKNPEDMARARIYERVLERCMPVRVNDLNIRDLNKAANMERAKQILGDI